MFAFAAEVVVFLLAAALTGGVAGWLIGRIGRERAVAAAREDATAGTLTLADDLYARTQRLHVVEARLNRASEQLAGRQGALAAANERLRVLETHAEVRDGEFDALEHERARLAARVGELVAQLVSESAENAAAVAAARGEIDAWRMKLAAAEVDFGTLAARVRELEPAVADLRRKEAAVADAVARLASAESAAAGRQREIDRLAAAIEIREAQIAGLRARVAVLEPLEAALAASGADGETLRARIAALEEREAALMPVAAGVPAPMAAASAATRLPEVPGPAPHKRAGNGDDRDDLKQIPGIGPALERLLHRSGVYTFRQIANWRAEDVNAMSEKIKDFQARLRRDNWIAGARREHRKKYGDGP